MTVVEISACSRLIMCGIRIGIEAALCFVFCTSVISITMLRWSFRGSGASGRSKPFLLNNANELLDSV
jgi:hypothetical protein